MKAPAYRVLTLILAALPIIAVGFSSAAAADSTNAYYAVYCTGDKNSLQANQDDSLDCGAGSSPKLEKQVKSGNTDPKGEHPVTIVEADCYPGTPQSLSSSNSVSCSEGPDASLTLRSHFSAAKKPKSKPKPKHGKKKSSPPPTTACNLDNGCDLIDKYVNPFINFLSIAFGLIAVISLILGGVQYSTSEGDPQKSSQAKDRISNTILAMFAYLVLYAFLQFIIPGGLFH